MWSCQQVGGGVGFSRQVARALSLAYRYVTKYGRSGAARQLIAWSGWSWQAGRASVGFGRPVAHPLGLA